MSTDRGFLALRLEGPLQSWGFDSQYSRRNSGLMPTKSGIAGICCAALGYSRGGADEDTFLAGFASLRMTSIVIPREGARKVLMVRRLEDYHTVQNTKTADGKVKDTHITHRQYLCDAAFGVLLEGDAALLSQIAGALGQPKWGIWLGRKACIPTAPILAGRHGTQGVKDDRGEALRLLIGTKPVESFVRQEEVDGFSPGRDTLPDQPLSFAVQRRRFLPRRVRILQASEIL